MRRRCCIVCIALILVLAPLVASAQDFSSGGFLSRPVLSYSGGVGSDGNPCDSCITAGLLSVKGSAALNYQSISLSFDNEGAGLGGIFSIQHDYAFGGVAFGLTAVVKVQDHFGWMANFTFLVPTTSRDLETINEGLTVFNVHRRWKTRNHTYSLEGAGFYNFYGAGSVLAGFRWDHLETSLERPYGASAGFFSSLESDESVLVANAFQPYLGFMVDQGGPSTVLRVGITGWPQLYGNLRYGQTFGGFMTGARVDNRSISMSDGYFWEIFGEYGLRETVYAGAAFRLFAKWTQYHFKGDVASAVNLVGGGTFASDHSILSISRNSWSLGVTVDIPVALPIPGV